LLLHEAVQVSHLVRAQLGCVVHFLNVVVSPGSSLVLRRSTIRRGVHVLEFDVVRIEVLNYPDVVAWLTAGGGSCLARHYVRWRLRSVEPTRISLGVGNVLESIMLVLRHGLVARVISELSTCRSLTLT